MIALLVVLAQEPLLKEHAELLDLLFKQGLFDPTALCAERVRGTVRVRTCRGTRVAVDASGWAVPGGRFILDSLVEVDPPLRPVPVDFVKEAHDRGFPGLRTADGLFSNSGPGRLVQAAWLRRLGRDADAAALVRREFPVFKPDELLKSYRRAVEWAGYDHAVNAFMVRDDADALDAAERVVGMGGDYLQEAQAIVDDLRRRREARTFGRAWAPLPEDLRRMPLDRRIRLLVDALEEVDARQDGSPGEPDLDGQAILRELVACGEGAVPGLLDCIDKDTRLTRTVSYFRNYQPWRDILGARDAAAVAVQAILRLDWNVRHYVKEPLRKTWERAKDQPLPQRMMRTLEDPASDLLEALEAADTVAHLGREPNLNRDAPRWRTSEPRVAAPRGAAEAVLAVLDRHIAWLKTHPPRMAVESSSWVRERYLDAVAELRQPQIVPDLARRAAAAGDTDTRLAFAVAAHRLGDSAPLNGLAGVLAGGLLAFPANDAREVAGNTPGFFQPGFRVLEKVVRALAEAGTPAGEKALAALTRANHPQHGWVRDRLLFVDPDLSFGEGWFSHPFGLQVLRRALDDVEPTGRVIALDGRRAAHDFGSGTTWSDLPDWIGPMDGLRSRTVERVCDVAAGRLNLLVPEAPRCHPLLEDSDERLRALKVWWDASAPFRSMTTDELECAGLASYRIRYVRR